METPPSALMLRLDGLTYAEIGGRLGVSRQRIQQLLAPPAAIRKLVVNRAQGLCEKCGVKADRGGHVHHKASSGLLCDQYHDLDNLALLCPSCHRRVHRPTTAQLMRSLTRKRETDIARTASDSLVITRLRNLIAETDSQLGAARYLGISPSYLCEMLSGKRRPGRKVLRALKLVRVDVYEDAR